MSTGPTRPQSIRCASWYAGSGSCQSSCCSYRDDELSRDHPLTQLLGDASHADQVHHLSPQRLTEPAVRELVADSALDVDEVFALSDGNPYFVSELVASAVGSSVPLTVVDAYWADFAGFLRPIKTSSSFSQLSLRLSRGNSSTPS